MLLKRVILRNQEDFESAIAKWTKSENIDTEIFDGKVSLTELVDSIVILHADHNISKENNDLRELLKKNHIPGHQVDINGTISASVSSLCFWLENNKPKNVLFVGDAKLAENHRLNDYLKSFGEALKN